MNIITDVGNMLSPVSIVVVEFLGRIILHSVDFARQDSLVSLVLWEYNLVNKFIFE